MAIDQCDFVLTLICLTVQMCSHLYSRLSACDQVSEMCLIGRCDPVRRSLPPCDSVTPQAEADLQSGKPRDGRGKRCPTAAPGTHRGNCCVMLSFGGVRRAVCLNLTVLETCHILLAPSHSICVGREQPWSHLIG